MWFARWRAAVRLREVRRQQQLVEQHRALAEDAIRRIRAAETEYTFGKAKEWLDRRRERMVMTGIYETYSHYGTLIAYPELWVEIEHEIAIKEQEFRKANGPVSSGRTMVWRAEGK